MAEAFSFLRRPLRDTKPRNVGVTMVLDKGMGVEELGHWLKVSADYTDLIKFGWGTSAIFDERVIAKKCELIRNAAIEVCPGGTLMEISFLQGKMQQFLENAKILGFSCIEVSDGTVPMGEDDKLRCIEMALNKGFRVVSEVGSKIVEEDNRLHLEERVDLTRRELASGVWKVIMEARESGTLGIFDSSGHTKADLLQGILKEISMEKLIFEAPLKSQQVDLINRLGNGVNLGNIAPNEIIPLETLRLGFRGDTVRKFHSGLPTITIGLGSSDALEASHRGDIIVVIDALRATSTIVSALASGMKSVKTVATVEACVGEVTAGERGGKKIPQLDFDNSPTALVQEQSRLKNKKLVLTTTNGTECILAASSNPKAKVIIGSLLNATAISRYILETANKTGCNITIIMAGRNNQLAIEDLIVASEISFLLKGSPIQGKFNVFSSEDIVIDFIKSDSGKNLSNLGKSEDVIFCAQKDQYNVVPVYYNGEIILS